jgi:AAA+ ATPase superfamily predicted ATPase
MALELKKNPKIDLTIPQFVCDKNPLGEHLNKYDMLKHLNCFGFTGLIGRPQSGKTSLLISFLTGKRDKKIFRRVFDHLILVMPSSSRNSIKKNPFKDHPQDKMFEDLDLPTIQTIYEDLKIHSSLNQTTFLILDDIGASCRNKEIQKLLREIIYNRRHLKVHIFVLLQSFLSLQLEIRKMFTNVIMFKPPKAEFEKLFEELIETKKDQALAVMKFVYDKPHQYLFLNVESQRMYKMFDEIIFKQDKD